MLKLIGACLLFLGGVGLAFSLVRRETERLLDGEAYLEFLRFVRGEIHAFARPREEIFRRFENPHLAANGFLAALRASGSIEEALSHTSPPPDAPLAACLTAFDRSLGRGYLSEELAACDLTVERVASYTERVRGEYPARVRVRRAATLTGTLLLILLLL